MALFQLLFKKESSNHPYMPVNFQYETYLEQEWTKHFTFTCHSLNKSSSKNFKGTGGDDFLTKEANF